MRAYSAPSGSIDPIRNRALNNLSENARRSIRSNGKWLRIAALSVGFVG